MSIDAGEIAANALALERGIRYVLIDERAGRAAAISLGLQPSGLLGLLVEAKKRSLVPGVLALLDRLQDGARFRIGDDLRRRIAILAKETP
jgi:predicted nucleic acid-binding protein